MVNLVIKQPLAAKGFIYSDAPQRSPEWQQLGIGKVTSSNLHRWLAVSKKPNKEGIHTPLKARLDYERELSFEKTFGVGFSRFVTVAMQEGIDNESFLRDEYTRQTGREVREAGCFYNERFRASPDGLVGSDGGLELKWLQDTSWTEVLASGKPYSGSSGDHYLQCQGNMLASGRKWWDYAAGNPNTRKLIILRVERDEEVIQRISDSLVDLDNIVSEFDTKHVYDFAADAPIIEDTEEVIWT